MFILKGILTFLLIVQKRNNLNNIMKGKFCCYETTNTITGKKYRGKSYTEHILKDHYIGSGTLLKADVKKYGKDSFTVKIVKEFETEKEAYDFEKEFVVVDPENYYNLTPGGEGGSAGCNTMNNGIVQTRVDPSIVDIMKRQGWILGELLSAKQNRRRKAKEVLEKKYGVCTGAMLSEEARNKSKQAHIARYGNVCGHMHTPEIVLKSLKSRTEKYGNPCGACHTPEGEKLAFEKVMQSF